MKKLYLAFVIFSTLISCNTKEKNTSQSIKDVNTTLETKTTKPEVKKRVIDHYICFKDNKKSSRIIWVSYDHKNIAISIKYKGQTQSIPLELTNEDYIKGGTHPTIIKHYDEIYNGLKNGSYSITHSGNWDYVKYTRAKDSKEFNFTIDHTANPYGKTPCF